MIGMQSCKSSLQALTMARAVELAGPEVFSVTVANDEWIVWFRFDPPGGVEMITTHFLRLWKAEQEYERRSAARRKSPRRKSSPNPKTNKPVS